jgi:hypothetical protein
MCILDSAITVQPRHVHVTLRTVTDLHSFHNHLSWNKHTIHIALLTCASRKLNNGA